MTGAGFQDHFSERAESYARFRPRYPAELMDWLASLTPGRALAWDAGTGNGQAAVALATHFQRVVATDASQDQIAYATPHPGVSYLVERAEAAGLPDASCDLVTAAQALHWFDPPAFFAEARRVLKPGGAIAVWSYVDPALAEPELDAVLQDFARAVWGDWPPERPLAESGYRTLAFPFEEVTAPVFHLVRQPTMEELAGYLRTWSATRRYIRRTGMDPVAAVEARLVPLWPRGARNTLRWPMHIRAGVRLA